MPVVASRLLQDLRRQVRTLEDDLRTRAQAVPEMGAELRNEYDKGRQAGRIGEAFESWRDDVLTQAAVHWVLGCVFVRFLEDNELLPAPLLAGPGARARMAADQHTLFFQQADHRTSSDREYLLHAFAIVAALPSGERLFDRAHNPVWTFGISADAARDLLGFWRQVDPNSGGLVHDFTDPRWDTRYLGDLYQDLSDAARSKYALLQTPEFVEEFILDRTLEPALREFGLAEVRMIDPTCGSGHFLLGAFERLLRMWQLREPGTVERALVQRALDAVNGVDINPFAVAIARFRLLIAALKASRITRLSQAPNFRINVATGDSLLFGTREGELALGGTAAELRHRGIAFHMEDADEADRILSRQYHAVVGNPPYITVKDRALNQTYRQIFSTCHMKYALSVPFIERFWQLAFPGSKARSAGFVGMINANSFMKREFGKKVVEEFFPRVDLTHLVDTAGAYIPGHGTPTVILFGRNRAPVSGTIRAVMGIKGEPSIPAVPSKGEVWTAILEQIDVAGSESALISVADVSRSGFQAHPWSISGGGAVELKELIEAHASQRLHSEAEAGIGVVTLEDDAYHIDPATARRRSIPPRYVRGFVLGEIVRDWRVAPGSIAIFPHDATFAASLAAEVHAWLWPLKTGLAQRVWFNKRQTERGYAWFAYGHISAAKFRTPLSIAFAEVATHNHFVLDRGGDGNIFGQTAPIIKLPSSKVEVDHYALLGVLNSSVGCFWLKMVAHNKGSTVDQYGARQRTAPFEDFYQFNATKVEQFPLPSARPVDLTMDLDVLAGKIQVSSPSALRQRLPLQPSEWMQCHVESDRMLREMIALQEELDWRCYRLYGITPDELTYRDAAGEPLTPPALRLGERAFEVVLARRMEAGEEETTWFQRHGSTPITELPAHWPADYRALVERRIDRIEKDRYVGLVERPEYKRRWNTEPWEAQATRALQEWLKTRLEDAAYWPEPRLRTTRALADRAQRDADFMAVAELLRGHAGFDVHALVRELVEAEAVPFLPVLRYRATGLRKREVWERTWELQRQEDAIDAQVAAELRRDDGESEAQHQARVAAEQKRRKQAEVGDIARPPRYTSADFASTRFWALRGALDVPKERFVSYPFCSRENDPSLLVGWAGWNHLQQAQALGEWYNELVQQEGWSARRLTPVLAGLAELVPWLKQWHGEPDPVYGRMDLFFEAFLNDQLHAHELTPRDLGEWTPPVAPRARRRGAAAA